MGIRDYVDGRYLRVMTLDFETSNFKNIGYWLKSLKQRFKGREIIKIKCVFIVDYKEVEEENINE